MAPTPLEKAERLGVEYAESLGCSTVEELRELPWKVLDEAIGPQIPPKYYFGTIIDGYFLQHTLPKPIFVGNFQIFLSWWGTPLEKPTCLGAVVCR